MSVLLNPFKGIVHEDLSICDVIVGVKEVPVADLIPHKTYCFFSHTHKVPKTTITYLIPI